MNNFLKILLAVVLCTVAAASSRAEGRAARRGAVRVRPRAPQPMRVRPDTRLRPSGGYQPPVVRYDLKPSPRRPAGPVARPGPAAFHAPDHNLIVGVAGLAAGVFAYEAAESVVNRTYWHADNNVRYAHMYDGHVHWYGFYDGPRFYWTRYEDNRWWWFDQTANRWLYWYDSHWWWHNPVNPATPYVVINDNYYPYPEIEANPQLAPGVTSAPGPTPTAPSAPPQAAMATAPGTAPGGAPPTGDDAVRDRASAAMAALGKAGHGNRTYVSPDSTREVQIYGDRHEAFLYDRTGGGEPQFIAFLASGARRAQFSEAGDNRLQVLLMMQDGSYDVFDTDGHSLLPPAAGSGEPPAPAMGADATQPAPPSAPPIPAP